MKWSNALIGEGRWQRQFDDQIGITVAPSILAPERAWDAYSHNITMMMFHNNRYDGKKTQHAGGFLKWWKHSSSSSFPEAKDSCDAFIKVASR
jgi:hypothetical protein